MTTQRLTIFLLRDVEEFDDALADDAKAADWHDLSATSGLDGRLYTKKSFPKTPSWAGYVKPIVDDSLDELRSASASALLVIKVDERTFALTFGYGRSFIDQTKIERRFGLKVALNMIDETQIRSLDTKLFDEMVVSKNTQTSRKTELPTFGVDVVRDILRAVTGVAREGSGYKTVSGADALVVGVPTSATTLPDILRELHDYYKARTYEPTFGWVDHLAEVRDPSLAAELDDRLIQMVREKDTETSHLAMPENLDWEDIEYFEISPTRRQTQFTELDLDAYIAHAATKAAHITIEQLKQRKVAVKFVSSADAVPRWSVYQCIVSEQRLNGDLFALVEGRWFSVADTLVQQVDTALSVIPQMSVILPPGRPGETEEAYNRRAADASPDLRLLDRQLVKPSGAKTKLEFCDLISRDGSLIHVKQKSRSSTLSHLFAQGHVSAEAFTDGKLRDEVRGAIVRASISQDATPWLDLIPPDGTRIDREKVTVAYAVIANSKASGNDWLPFFSRLTLMQTVRDLNRLGFMHVALARVPLE